MRMGSSKTLSTGGVTSVDDDEIVFLLQQEYGLRVLLKGEAVDSVTLRSCCNIRCPSSIFKSWDSRIHGLH